MNSVKSEMFTLHCVITNWLDITKVVTNLVPYFKDPEKSILKTVIMSLTGELEFENVEFGEKQPIYGKLVYLLWVFFIMLVLVNLLNGLLLRNIIIKKSLNLYNYLFFIFF